MNWGCLCIYGYTVIPARFVEKNTLFLLNCLPFWKSLSIYVWVYFFILFGGSICLFLFPDYLKDIFTCASEQCTILRILNILKCFRAIIQVHIWQVTVFLRSSSYWLNMTAINRVTLYCFPEISIVSLLNLLSACVTILGLPRTCLPVQETQVASLDWEDPLE